MAKSGKGYLNAGLPWIVNLILAIIPFTSWLLGGVTRIIRGHLVAGILQLIPPITLVFWILDIVGVATTNDLKFTHNKNENGCALGAAVFICLCLRRL